MSFPEKYHWTITHVLWRESGSGIVEESHETNVFRGIATDICNLADPRVGHIIASVGSPIVIEDENTRQRQGSHRRH